MADTIEWLETIGKNAKLRHAPPEVLAHTLEQADASAVLKAAVMHGDSTLLSAEFGQKDMHSENSTHTHPRPPHHPGHPDHPHHPHHPPHPGEHEKEKPGRHEDEPGKSKPPSR